MPSDDGKMLRTDQIFPPFPLLQLFLLIRSFPLFLFPSNTAWWRRTLGFLSKPLPPFSPRSSLLLCPVFGGSPPPQLPYWFSHFLSIKRFFFPSFLEVVSLPGTSYWIPRDMLLRELFDWVPYFDRVVPCLRHRLAPTDPFPSPSPSFPGSKIFPNTCSALRLFRARFLSHDCPLVFFLGLHQSLWPSVLTCPGSNFGSVAAITGGLRYTLTVPHLAFFDFFPLGSPSPSFSLLLAPALEIGGSPKTTDPLRCRALVFSFPVFSHEEQK